MKKFLAAVLAVTMLISVVSVSAAPIIADSIPEIGTIFKDDLNSYSVWSDLAFSKGGPYAMGPNYAKEDGNGYVSINVVDQYLAYRLTQHGISTPVSTGVMQVKYKVRVPKDPSTGDNNNVNNALYFSTLYDWSHGAYFNSVCYNNTKPFILFCNREKFDNNDAWSYCTSEDIATKKEIEFDTWYDVTVVVDYENSKVRQYLGDEKVVDYSFANASHYAASDFYFNRRNARTNPSPAFIDLDDLCIEKIAQDPETLNKYSAKDAIPAVGEYVMKDNFDDYSVYTDLKVVNGGIHYVGTDVVKDDGNVYVHETNDNQGVAYWATQHNIPIINSGILEYKYKVRVPKSVNTDEANNEHNALYVNTYKYWNGGSDGATFNSVVYNNTQPFISFENAYYSAQWAFGQWAETNNVVKKDIDFNKWYEISVYVDYDNKQVTQMLDGDKVAQYTYSDGAAVNYAFDAIRYYRRNKDDKSCYIDLDDVSIKRVAALPSGEPEEPVEPDVFTVKNSLPETGLICKDNIDTHSTDNASLVVKNGGIFTRAGNGIGEESSNKYVYLTANDAGLVYQLSSKYPESNLNVPNIDSGLLKLSYKIKVPATASYGEKANGLYVDTHINYDINTGGFGSFFNSAAIDASGNAYMLFGKKYLTSESSWSYCTDDTNSVKKDIDFDTWYDVAVYIDYDKNEVIQTLDGEIVSSYVFADASKYEFNTLRFGRRNAGVVDAGGVTVRYTNSFYVDDIKIQRLVTESYETLYGAKIFSGEDEIALDSLTGTETVNVKFDAASDNIGNVVVAAYKDNALVAIESKINAIIAGGTNSVAIALNPSFAGADAVKAFVFSDFNNMYPLAEPAVYTE